MTLREVWIEMEGFRLLQKLEDERTARLMALLAEVNRDPKRRRRPFTPEEFMPQYRRQDQKPEEQARFLRSVAIVLGGKGVKSSG